MVVEPIKDKNKWFGDVSATLRRKARIALHRLFMKKLFKEQLLRL